jgi:hypothetical protein
MYVSFQFQNRIKESNFLVLLNYLTLNYDQANMYFFFFCLTIGDVDVYL